MEKGNQPN